MNAWGTRKARLVLAARESIGWRIDRQRGSHRVLAKEGHPNVVFAFDDGEEIGPRMLARIARHTGLRPDDLK
ncbi:MAG: type II toxin-antitoxin system HicA family toxin [Sneathiellaceae bacterium]